MKGCGGSVNGQLVKIEALMGTVRRQSLGAVVKYIISCTTHGERNRKPGYALLGNMLQISMRD